MDIKNIKELVKLVEKSDIHELDIQEKELQIRIVKNSGAAQAVSQIQHIPSPVQQPAAMMSGSGQSMQANNVSDENVSDKRPDNIIEIPSPMVGTFYRTPAPDAAPYVKEGDTISSGQILCIIEAMKLMNEIEAEISGKIVKILVENGEPVEYNQALFLVEKS
ncbi:acetyl-CoA carboxylase biotin carboxyl carrier protein [bacterium]|nr:acetyl-CoA carboxylase biotin carboxyl carrier protein [bacterium]